MKLRLSIGFTALCCVLLSSCYPYNEGQAGKKPNKGPEKTTVTAEDVKKKEEAARKKAEEDLKKKEQEATTGGDTNREIKPPEPDKPVDPPVEKPRTDYAFANKVPGKEGFVFSPYNNKVVDVRDIPSGTLVQDPTYPPSEKKYFRVP
jgi:hypothetical protein